MKSTILFINLAFFWHYKQSNSSKLRIRLRDCTTMTDGQFLWSRGLPPC